MGGDIIKLGTGGITEQIRERGYVFGYKPIDEAEWDEIVWELCYQPTEDDDIWEEI